MKRDYYEVLGIPRDSDQQKIKSAYRKLAVRYHPDKNPGDQEAEAKFKEAAEAYSVLSEPEKRSRYDQFGHQGVQGAGGGGGFDPSIFADFSDILGDMFGLGDVFGGRRRGRGGAGRGADLRYDLKLSFEEAAFGVTKKLRIPRLEACKSCSGSGAAAGSRPVSCSACGGHGQVRFTQGFFTVARPCPQCKGEGQTLSNPCPKCSGEGRLEHERSLDVTIPAGVDTGARLRLTGEGEQGRRGGTTGDLYVVLLVQEHESFQRDGFDVLSEQGLTYTQAVLGSTVKVETLHGSVDLDIPQGTSPGKIFRLKGKGIDHLGRGGRGGRGDHILRVEVDVPHPSSLAQDQLDLLRELAKIEGKKVKEGVFEKVKKKVKKEIFG